MGPVPVPRSDGVPPSHWHELFSPHTTSIQNTLQDWEQVMPHGYIQQIFHNAQHTQTGTLCWRTGDVERFVQLVFEACDLPGPHCPSAVLYQFARECGAGLCGSLSATNAASFIRLVLERIVILTQASGASSKELATSKKHYAPQAGAQSKDPKAIENSTIGWMSRPKRTQPAL